ncbi:SH3 domain-containing protein [Sagittula stellata]|uniref:Uncharacterized protein n=1 Tax=Sagittula stellata (strain ATCC 700073 / DSM 11524 / E-37) TaxID=388399 RepID=A3K5D4_SAGS3|nr:SH3 domain-containing protein [Sagittula stellata]EBA07735.1 hypothetical protein SSE37_14153 [Sagittula stellata E-37]
MLRIVPILAALLLIAPTARAAEIVEGDAGAGCNLTLAGAPARGDARAIRGALRDLDQADSPPRLCLEGRGGSISGALEVADLVAQVPMATHLTEGAICEGPCALIFIAGARGARVMHPKAILGFSAPLVLPDNETIPRAEAEAAYRDGLSAVAEVIRLRTRRDLELPDSLLLALLEGDEHPFRVATVGDAARWGIEVAPVALPVSGADKALQDACANADGARLDLSPADLPSHDREVGFMVDSFGASAVRLRSEAAFGAAQTTRCHVELSLDAGPEGDLGTLRFGGADAGTTPSQPLSSFAFHDPATAIADLPEPGIPSAEASSVGDFRIELDARAREALSAVTFPSCWVASPQVKVVNVTDFVNLRADAGFGATVLREVPLGEPLTIVGSQSLEAPGDQDRARTCRDACNAFALDPTDTAQKEQALDCISRNVFWYEVSDAQGRLGYISRKYLSD